MSGLARRLWNSPTFTTWLLQAVAPFKLLVLTPLVLTRLTTIEIDVFYLFASANLLAALLSARLADTFMKMIGFAHGGATSLSLVDGPAGEPLPGDPTGPSWPLLMRTYRMLGLLLALCAVPALLFFVASSGYAVGRLTGWDPTATRLWAVVIVASCIVPVELVLSRYEIVLAGTGHLAQVNRVKVLGNLAIAVGAAVALFVTPDLLVMVIVQLVLTVLARLLYLGLLPPEIKTRRGGFAWDAQVLRWAWPPLWKGLVGMLSGIGVQRTAGLFLVSTGIPGYASSFLLAQTILQTLYLFALAPLTSQFPRYASELATGRRRGVVLDGMARIYGGTALLAAGVVGVALVLPPLLARIGSNIEFLDLRVWLILGGLQALYVLLVAPATLYNVTNDIICYWRNVIAGVSAVGFFWYGAASQSYLPFALGFFVPYLITIHIYGVRRCLGLGGVTYGDVLRASPARLRQAITGCGQRGET